MSQGSSSYSRHHNHLINVSNRNTFGVGASSIHNGQPSSRQLDGERKRNYKLIIDPVLKGRGFQKIYRFDGEFEGQAAVIPKDPRSRRTRLWSTRTKADLPVPKFKIDKYYVGIPPQRDVILNGLNDNVDKKFLQEMCDKFGNIEGIKIFCDPITKRHLGKARVGFSTSASAKLAVAKLDGTSIMGCIVQAEFEHKVEMKYSQKPHFVVDPAHKTPPSIERIVGRPILPTPPPSISSPANSTPSTPGSMGLSDPRKRNCTNIVIGEKLPSKSPSWPMSITQQNKTPVFEPVSPPSDKIQLPPPPPPDCPPPMHEKCRTPSPVHNSSKLDRYQNKDYKLSSKASRDVYKSNRREEDYDRRKREYGGFRRLSEERGRDSRYYKDHYTRESFDRRESWRSSYNDCDSRRNRDPDDSYGSEKSSKSTKEVSRNRVNQNCREIDSRSRSPRPRSDSYEKEKRSMTPDMKNEDSLSKKDKLNKIESTKLNNGKNIVLSSHDNMFIQPPPLPPDVFSDLVVHMNTSFENREKFVPEVEDISPVSSPTQPQDIAIPDQCYPSMLPSYPTDNAPCPPLPNQVEVKDEQADVSMDKKIQSLSTEDNDDAMSLSSISSNEETLEINKPVPPVPPPLPNFTPAYPPAPPIIPPPFMPPYNPTIPPPPTYSAVPVVAHRLPVPPLSIATIPPPHPLVPPAFHATYSPQFVSTLNGVPTPSTYPTFPSGPLPSPQEQRVPHRKNWKTRISEEVLKRIAEELALILKKDVLKRLVENSAFKALDGWWDNVQKAKDISQSETVLNLTTSSTTVSSHTVDMTSNITSPLSTTINQGGMLGLGLRASLPKMPSFRKRRPQRTTHRSPDRDQKRTATDSDSDIAVKRNSELKRLRLDTGDDLSVGSPCQFHDDNMEEPPATSVRNEEKRGRLGSSLYRNIYSSMSESESSQSEESDSEETGEDDSEWERTSRTSRRTSESEDESKSTQKEIATPKIPHTPPDTPPRSPVKSPVQAPTTPTASPIDITTVDDRTEKITVDEDILPYNKCTLTAETTGITTIDNVSSTYDSEPFVIKKEIENMNNEESNLSEASSIIQSHKHIPQKVMSTSDDSAFEVKKTVVITENELQRSNEETIVKPTQTPVVELPLQFDLRPYWEDDRLVYDFLLSGLDHEDASYLKIGFESLSQVDSDSVINAYWSFHTTTSTGVVNKGKRFKQEASGIRVHESGCARCEGFYKIGMKEKAKYLEAARRQVDMSEAVTNKKIIEKEANKAKQQSRENRALQRRLAASFQLEDFGDILKFNQLKVRKKKLTFSKSCIHDWGLFALEPIARDEMVIEYVGEVIRQAIADDREKRYERLGIGSSYLFRVDSDTIIDATKYGNLARFINHCCEPNCYAKVVTFESEKKIVIYSKRDICVNEEITYDYKFPIEDEKIPCLCGAAQCRGTLN